MKPRKLRSDQGSAYNFFLIAQKVDHKFTFYETKANYTERVIKTIKRKIFKYLTARESFRWVENFTASYNNARHRSIKMTPIQTQTSNQYQI